MPVSGYIKVGFELKNRSNIIKTAVRKLKGQPFDAIACIGVSGMIYAPILAYVLQKHLIVIRKSEQSHASEKVETLIASGRYIIVDDFTATGRTIKDAVAHIKDHHSQLKCVGVYLWKPDSNGSETVTDLRLPCLSGAGRISE
jgi:adenine/guanine phosphoribosyltransferase-like PRPP-binding protein